MIDIKELNNKLIALKTECKLILNSIDEKEAVYNELKQYSDSLQKARALVAEAGKYTQGYLKDYIENMVSTALEAVFEEDYKFVINFDIKRNKPEANIFLKIRGEEVNPEDSVGGGVLDVASFALRVVLWSIETPRSTNTLIMDEAFKFLHGKSDNILKMLKDLSRKLDLQLIMVSQLPEMAENADKVWNVVFEKDHSVAKLII